jgi:hypothetical protein
MYTALRLIIIGWQFSGNEGLGMVTVKEEDSIFYSLKYVPRITRDQLNHALELKMMELAKNILKGT